MPFSPHMLINVYTYNINYITFNIKSNNFNHCYFILFIYIFLLSIFSKNENIFATGRLDIAVIKDGEYLILLHFIVKIQKN